MEESQVNFGKYVTGWRIFNDVWSDSQDKVRVENFGAIDFMLSKRCPVQKAEPGFGGARA